MNSCSKMGDQSKKRDLMGCNNNNHQNKTSSPVSSVVVVSAAAAQPSATTADADATAPTILPSPIPNRRQGRSSSWSGRRVSCTRCCSDFFAYLLRLRVTPEELEQRYKSREIDKLLEKDRRSIRKQVRGDKWRLPEGEQSGELIVIHWTHWTLLYYTVTEERRRRLSHSHIIINRIAFPSVFRKVKYWLIGL